MTGRLVICQDERRGIYVNRDIAGWLAPPKELRNSVMCWRSTDRFGHGAKLYTL